MASFWCLIGLHNFMLVKEYLPATFHPKNNPIGAKDLQCRNCTKTKTQIFHLKTKL